MLSTGELDACLIWGSSDSLKFSRFFNCLGVKLLTLCSFYLFPFRVLDVVGKLFLSKNIKESTNLEESTFSLWLFIGETYFNLECGLAGCLNIHERWLLMYLSWWIIFGHWYQLNRDLIYDHWISF